MSSDDIQSAIEFLLKNQANFEVQLEKTNQQLARTDEQLARTDQQLARTDQQLARTDEQLARTDQQLELTTQQVTLLAETQREFIQAMLGHVEAQRGINADMRQTMRGLAQGQQRTQQDIADLSQAQRQTQQEISDLTKIVGGLVKAVYENGS